MSFCGALYWYPCFGLLMTSALGFEARVDISLARFLARIEDHIEDANEHIYRHGNFFKRIMFSMVKAPNSCSKIPRPSCGNFEHQFQLLANLKSSQKITWELLLQRWIMKRRFAKTKLNQP